MKFNWDGFTEQDFTQFCSMMENNNENLDGWYHGRVRVGELCFDLVTRLHNEKEISLDYDVYIGGVNDDYSRTPDGYPYAEYGGGGFYNTTLIDITYEQFKVLAEEAFISFINNNGEYCCVSLIDKANQPLHVW